MWFDLLVIDYNVFFPLPCWNNESLTLFPGSTVHSSYSRLAEYMGVSTVMLYLQNNHSNSYNIWKDDTYTGDLS